MHFPRLKAIVFDLDNTLLDHNSAEQQAITAFLPRYYHEPTIGTLLQHAPQVFLSRYRHWNEILWRDLAMKRLSADDLKWQRFAKTLLDVAPVFTDEDAKRLGREMGTTYLELYADHWSMLPKADETLLALKNRFKLGLITNGFTEQQEGKLARFGWQTRFDAALLSGKVGVMKPHKEIFDMALAELGVEAHETVYVGDHYETDIVGAQAAGWRAIWFNPHQAVRAENHADWTISALPELLALQPSPIEQ